ncbi:hypothetical protein [Acetivibrio clariflavus]|uniref:Uncharacterized protein n=1 Tax=Acetivibrio clariflavus (strain DSM 19732 / NBRC 101661 / EBR45) TaxID=720554 RepID=G8LVU6_ACECE|nr:hypothetical protein [Acetivibrio clariflavus]AEV67513.1 hypothetical protein Clocl_0817 [Acetivibrio clariflavus DSM 19732]
MEICYENELAMPSSYSLVGQEEMAYVEGGYYMTNDDCKALAFAIGATVSMNIATVASLIIACGTSITAVLASVPVIGWIAAAYGAVTIINSAESIASGLMTALWNGTGMEVSVGFRWFTPYIKCTAK